MTNDPIKILAESPMQARQVIAVAICVLLAALDGYDILSISFAAPGIASEWGINRAALGIVLSMELIGMGIGSIFLGSLADQVGRQRTILGCQCFLALGMYLAAVAPSVTVLSVIRLFTGFTIGGILASINAMAAEFSNARYKNLSVIAMASGYPFGVVSGGMVATYLLDEYTWRAVFQFGAFVTIFFLPLVWFLLPESISFLNNKRPAGALEKINTILVRMKHHPITSLPPVGERRKTSFTELFQPYMLPVTTLLTTAFFLHIMTFYFILKWIPKIVVDMGFAPSSAGGVLVWTNIGGLAGCILVGLLSSRFSLRNLVFAMLALSCFTVAVFGRSQENLLQLSVIAAAAGFFMNAGIVGLYALFAQSFPSEIRAGGTGFAIGVGRAGAALSPILAGFLFVAGFNLQTVAVLMGTGSLVGGAAILFLNRSKLMLAKKKIREINN